MKKLLAVTLTLASLGFMGWSESRASAVNNAAAPSANAGEPQYRYRNWRRNNRNYRSRVRVVRTTRIVHYGFRTYRLTYLVRYLPNGRTQTTLIRRERIA